MAGATRQGITRQLGAYAKRFPRPTRAAWRQTVRMSLAALLAYSCTGLVGLHQGYWAVITCLVIVQGSLGATINAGIARVAGTAAGAVAGGVGAGLLRIVFGLPEWATLLIVIVPLALLAASRAIFRLAPLTGALVLLVAGSSNFGFAMSRVAEIALGCVIGVLVSLFVLPERATAVLIAHAAGILEQLGEFAVILLTEPDAPVRERSAARLRAAFAQVQNDLKEIENERAAHLLRSDPFPEHLSRHLQRLRTDVNMLGRVAPPDASGETHAALAAAIRLHFNAAAETLRHPENLVPPAMLGELIAEIAPTTPFGFALATLHEELAALAATLAEWAEPSGPLAKAGLA